MGKIKNVFTMATLYLIKNLLNFSSRLLPVFIIILSLLKLSKVLINVSWYLVLGVLIVEAVLIILSLFFDSVFFKNKKMPDSSSDNKDEQNNDNNANKSPEANKFSVLNIAVIFFAFLGIIFVILKLFNAVAWNWVWVLSPLWLSSALVIIILLICIIVFIVSALSKKNKIEDNSNNHNINSSSENTQSESNQSESN